MSRACAKEVTERPGPDEPGILPTTVAAACLRGGFPLAAPYNLQTTFGEGSADPLANPARPGDSNGTAARGTAGSEQWLLARRRCAALQAATVPCDRLSGRGSEGTRPGWAMRKPEYLRTNSFSTVARGVVQAQARPRWWASVYERKSPDRGHRRTVSEPLCIWERPGFQRRFCEHNHRPPPPLLRGGPVPQRAVTAAPPKSTPHTTAV